MESILTSIQFDLSALNQNNVIIAVVGYVIVFIALVSLYAVFHSGPKVAAYIKKHTRGRKSKQYHQQTHEENLTGEINAAISTALYLYFSELHDEESHVMTIERVSRTYSPWSSKIYSVRNYFNRR